METKVVTLASGATLEISVAPFQVVNKLIKAIAKEAKNIKIDGALELDFTEAIKGGQYNFFKDIVFTMIASEEIEELIFKCFDRCLYNKQKVTKDLFENNIEARGDYFEMAWEVGQFNVSPFIKVLLSRLSLAMPATSTSTPK